MRILRRGGLNDSIADESKRQTLPLDLMHAPASLTPAKTPYTRDPLRLKNPSKNGAYEPD